MTKSKTTKRALLLSVISMLLCLSMLVGSTFAWFTDSVTSGKNKIVAGNLDVELYHTNANVTTEEPVGATTKLFTGIDGKDILWEPGVVVYENFTVKNVGTLALKYKLSLNVANFNTVKDTTKSLKDVLKVALVENGFTGDRTEALGLTYDKTIEQFAHEGSLAAGTAGTTGKTYGIVIYWEPSDVDNEYNINNDKKTSDDNDLFIDFGINLVATQDTVEKDSFDDQYDKDAWLALNATDNHDGTYSNGDDLYVKDDNHFVEVTEDTAVSGLYTAVESGDKYVATPEAWDAAAPAGGNVTVLNDIGKDYNNSTMEWNGTVYPVTNSTPFLDVTVDSDVDLSSKTITIESESGQNGIKVSKEYGSPAPTVTLSNGTITMDNSYGSGYPVVQAEKAEVTLDSMIVELTADEGTCVSAGSDGGKVVIKNTTVKGPNAEKGANAVFSGSKSTLEFENAIVIGAIRLEVNGGLIIKSGDFTQATFYFGGSTDGEHPRTIYAGTFATDPRTFGNDVKIAAGSTVAQNADGDWVVTAAPAAG